MPSAPTDPVEGLWSALGAVTGVGQLTIDRVLLDGQAGGGALFDHMQDCLALPATGLALTAAQLSALDPAGFFTVRGAAAVAGAASGEVTVTFYAAVSTADGSRTLEAALAFDSFPAIWLATTAFTSMPQVVQWNQDPAVVEGTGDAQPVTTTSLEASIFQDLPLQSAQAFYSSFGFSDPAAEVPADSDEQPLFTTTARPVAPFADETRAGLNLAGEVPLTASWWEPLGLKLTSPLAVTGLVGSPEPGAPTQVELRHTIAASPAPLQVAGSGGISFQLTGVTMRSGLAMPAGPDPSVGIDAMIVGCTPPLDVHLGVAVGSGQVTMTAAFESPQDVDDLLHKLGIDTNWMPDSLGTLQVCDVGATFELANPSFESVTLSVRPEMPWEIVPDFVAVEPTFTLSLGTHPYVEFIADWYLGESGCQLVAFGRAPDGVFSLGLAPGHQLDMIGFVNDLVSKGTYVPDIELVDLEITGSLADHSCSFRAESGQVWACQVAGAELAVTDVLIDAQKNDEGFDLTLSGLLELGSLSVAVELELHQDIVVLEVSVPNLEVGDLLDHVLKDAHPPAVLGNFALHQLALQVKPQTGWLNASAGSSDVVQLTDHFSFKLDSLEVTREPGAKEGDPAVVTAALDLTLTVMGVDIDLTGSHAADAWTFSFVGATQTPIDLGALIDALEGLLHLDFPLPVGGLSIGDLDLTVVLGTEQRTVAFSCHVLEGKTRYGSAVVVAQQAKAGDPWIYAVELKCDVVFHFSELPLVGAALKELDDPGVTGIGLKLASEKLSAIQIADLLKVVGQQKNYQFDGDFAAGATLLATLTYGSTSEPVELPLSTPPAPPPAPPAPSAGLVLAAVPLPAAPSPGVTKWVQVDRTVGGFTLSRAGLRYDQGSLLVELDASLALGGFQMSVTGLGIGAKLDGSAPAASLDGLTASYAGEGLSVEGGLVHDPVAQSYTGVLQVSAEELSLAVMARYAEATDSQPASFFAYGVLDDPPLGGPPVCFVEGFALGVGYNNRLHLPGIDGVATFSLVEAAFPANPLGKGQDLGQVIGQMTSQGDFSIERGESWLAAGLRFSSFELVESFALLTVQFGNSVELGLLGLARTSVPPDTTNSPLASGSLALEATYVPSTGILQVLACIGPDSFVLAPECHLTGGFAFCTWFKGIPSSTPPVPPGDFVVSLGGYHPAFQRPSHYPAVQRLGLSWTVSEELSIRGDCYFALTPQCVMAGGSLEVAFATDDLKAWFSAESDFLMYWKPFAYSAEVTCDIGVAFTLSLAATTITITAHVSVDVALHGPDFGGSAAVDLDIVKFVIPFGAGPLAPQFIGWNEFRTSFLAPADHHQAALGSLADSDVVPGVFTARPTAGLLKDLSATATGEKPRWVFHGERFGVSATSSVPFTTTSFNNEPKVNTPGQGVIGVGPMGLAPSDFSSDATLELLFKVEKTGAWVPCTTVSCLPADQSVPASLWSTPASALPSDPNTPALVTGMTTGLRLSRAKVRPDTTRFVPLAALQVEDPSLATIAWVVDTSPTTDTYAAHLTAAGDLTFSVDGQDKTCSDHVLDVVTEPAATRAATAAAMQRQGMPVTATVDVSALATTTVLDDWPAVASLGEVL